MTVDNQNAPISKIDESFDEDHEGQKYLSFMIGDEQYAISIDFVIEIIEVIKITPIPDMKNYVKGVINLRGKVIPVMDVRLRFTMEEKDHNEKTCIIVVRVEDIEIGLIVDTVTEVIDIPDERIDEPSNIYNKSSQRYVSGIGKLGKQIKIILDVSKLVLLKDFENIDKVA